MRKARKLIIASVAVFSLGVMVGYGVHSLKSSSFGDSTGERVEVRFDTSGGGFDVKQLDGRFSVSRDGKKVLAGKFAQSALYDQYANQIKEAEADGVKDISVKDNVVSWTYEVGKKHEVNKVYKVSEKTAAIVTSPADKKTAEDAYSRLRFRRIDKD